MGEAPDGTGLLTEELSQQCERLAREHEVDEAELKAATRRVLLAQREFRHQLDPLFRSETGWQASEPGQLPLVRKRLERFAKALQEIRESLTDLFGYRFCDEESVGVSIPVDDAALLMIPEHLRDDFGDLWEATVNLVGKIEVPKGSGTVLVPANWERLAAEEAARLWRDRGGTVRRDKNAGQSPFQKFALPWLHLLGSEWPHQVLRTVCK